MVQTIAISEGTTLKYLRDSFGLERSGDLIFSLSGTGSYLR